jgi:transposase InsO family protein
MARTMGISRASLYYRPKRPEKDWALKVRIEEVLRTRHSYGSRRLAQALGMGRERVRRVMRLYGVKPYRRHGKQYRKHKPKRAFPNLLMRIMPSYPNHVWVTDFTVILFHGVKVYLSTILDLFTRQLVSVHVAVRKGAALSVTTLGNAFLRYPAPVILHSDNGKEYEAQAFINMLEEYGITVSRSAPGCPWENGYQESFYDKFKVDFGDPNRYQTLGELVAALYRMAWEYNHERIHSALKMPPAVFAEQLAA